MITFRNYNYIYIKLYLDIMPSEGLAVSAVRGIAKVEVRQYFYGKVLLHMCVCVLAFGRGAGRQRVVAARAGYTE